MIMMDPIQWHRAKRPSRLKAGMTGSPFARRGRIGATSNGRAIGSPLQVATIMICVVTAATLSAQNDPARDLVNPFIGTGGHGHTFPGACVPNGLVQLSPDTRPDGYNDWDGASGYHYSDSVIYGFSHTHLSGTGVSDLCDVLLMPMSDHHSFDPKEYRSSFRKETEQAHAGYYSVHLEDHNVDVELTSTKRTGVHRYRFPKEEDAWVVLDLEHRDELIDQMITVIGNETVQGMRRSKSWAGDQWLYFVIEFSRPFKQNRLEPYMTQRGDVISHSPTKGAFQFAPTSEPLIVKVGISAVSIEGARRNLEAEVPHWDFDRVRAEAEAAWNAKLNKIQVEGGTREQQRIFHTALYHSYVAPYIFNDVDGHYRGMDGQVHHADHDVYTVFSLWDTFRSLHPLMTVLEPEMTRDWIKTFLLHYQQGGRLPVWELWGNETDCMIGYHSVSVIADAYLKGIRDFDAELALAAMVHTAELDHFGLEAYKHRGYISSEDAPESVSRTLEYAYDDWCIAQFAEAIGKKDIAARFHIRSRNWQNLFDPSTGFFRARRNGGFVEPFDPYEVNFHFTEANAWHYAFFVPHDMDRFIQLHGGTSAFGSRLDALFEASSKTTGREQSDITGLIGQYAHGNEPSHGFAYLYTRSAKLHLTDLLVAKVMRELYSDAPDGLSGNEDCGQMSAWYVWSALGLYPLTPGSTGLAFGMPLFDAATVTLPEGRSLVIRSSAQSGVRTHIERVMWNGTVRQRAGAITQDELLAGGTLSFELGPRAVDHPVQLPDDQVAMEPPPAPIVHAKSPVFSDSITVSITSVPGPWELRCAVGDGPMFPCPEHLTLHASGTVTAVAYTMEGVPGPAITAHFVKVDRRGTTIELESTYANQYSAGGPEALIDGLRGGNDFRTGEWQGYHGQDLQATIDLGAPKRVTSIGLSVLQDQKSWIWFPSEVEFAFSTNGRQWSTVRATHSTPLDADGAMTTVISSGPIAKRARYVKLIARNVGPCPTWHPGSGGTSWIFADEVLITTE
jgi:predicted alpha-1,2-mannosidase